MQIIIKYILWIFVDFVKMMVWVWLIKNLTCDIILKFIIFHFLTSCMGSQKTMFCFTIFLENWINFLKLLGVIKCLRPILFYNFMRDIFYFNKNAKLNSYMKLFDAVPPGLKKHLRAIKNVSDKNIKRNWSKTFNNICLHEYIWPTYTQFI